MARSRTTRVLLLGRNFLEDNDPKRPVELIKKTFKIYPYQPGGLGTSIATALYRPSYRKEAAEDAWQRCCLSGIKS